MSDYTPTEEQLIEAWTHQKCFNPICTGDCPERFPAMRAINKAKADALNEAADAICVQFGTETLMGELDSDEVEFPTWLRNRAQRLTEGS